MFSGLQGLLVEPNVFTYREGLSKQRRRATHLNTCLSTLTRPQMIGYRYRRRVYYTEEKAKVVAAVWGTELIKFLALLAILLHAG